ncbi:MAG: MiaB/RimO family radical SAM methylthiotransferase [Caldisericia bacterium]|nr:MiaB/RimO family radical SAM methylthiotransferase [Caldisericia bacterium]
MNEYTSLYLNSLLSSKGLMSDVKDSDYIIVNTCAVREKVKHKIYSYIGKVNKIKKKDAKLIVIGCLGEVNKEEIKNRFNPYIVGLYDKEEELFEIAKKIEGEIIKQKIPLVSRYLPIIFGCNHFCSYCIVPFARGVEKSKDFDLVIKEAEEIYKEGAKEIVLIGQNVNDYGKNLGIEDGFIKILKEVSKIPFERVSFLTSHPKNFKLSWIEELSHIKNLLHLFHLPLQSGSNKVLKLMRRGYTIEEYMKIVEKIREFFKDASITTDLLVGFPGEEEEDFLLTIYAVKKIEFDRAFMFSYSKRPKTLGERFECEIPEDEKLKRLNYLIKVQDEITLKKYSEYIGREVEVLIENIKDNKGIGKEKGGRVVVVDGVSEGDLGKIVKAKVERVNIRELFGKRV